MDYQESMHFAKELKCALGTCLVHKVSYFQGGIEITLIPVIGGVKLIGVHDAG
jgi:hypothetical protein